MHIGNPGDTPEIFEKVDPQTGKGVVVIFANNKGKFTYITKHPVVKEFSNSENTEVKLINGSHAKIEASFAEASAVIIFFGVK